jgi:uncharacterized membrane protein YhhN
MFYFGIVTTIFSTALHLIVRGFDFDVPYLPGVLKMTASTGFLITALAAGALRSRVGIAIFIGLIFSWFGDLFLIGSGSKYFLAGLVSFFAGHLCYATAFAMYRTNLRLAALAIVILLVPGYLLLQWILPGVKDPGLRGPVIAYTCVITTMLALATGCLKHPGGQLIFVGALLFYFSDIFVARSAFVASGFINSLVGLPLYFGGQAILAASIRFIDARRAPITIQNPKSKVQNEAASS